jgi:hypothetical protein
MPPIPGVLSAHAVVELYAEVVCPCWKDFVVRTELRIMDYPATRLLSRWKRKAGRYFDFGDGLTVTSFI